MWCKQCRQDVPGSATVVVGQFVCPRCSQTLAEESHGSKPADNERRSATREMEFEAPPRPWDPPLDPDDFDWDQNIKTLRALTAEIAPSLANREPIASSIAGDDALRTASKSSGRKIRRIDREHAPAHARHRSFGAALTWLVIWCSATAVVAGVVVVGWAIQHARTDLSVQGQWIAGAGLAGFLIGILMQLERIWHVSRRALDRIDELDDRLARFEESSLLRPRNEASSHLSYGHLVDGATPHIMLADIKSQLDLLTLKLSNRQAA